MSSELSSVVCLQSELKVGGAEGGERKKCRRDVDKFMNEH